MRTLKKVTLLIIFGFVLFQLRYSAILYADDENFNIEIAHHVGELRTVNVSKILTQSMVEIANESKEIDKKIIVSEQTLTETCITVDENSMPTCVLLHISKSRSKKKNTLKEDSNSVVFHDADEGKSRVLVGEILEKYQKLQPDFGLILPKYAVSAGTSWKPDEKQIKRLFEKEIQGKNTIDYKLVEIKKNQTTKSIFAVIERQLLLNFVIQNESEKTESTGIEKSRTTYVVDVDKKRVLSVSEAQVLIMSVSDNNKHQLVLKRATETTYEYSEAKLYNAKSLPALKIEQTERSSVNFNLKMLITSKKDGKQFVTSKNKETDRLFRRKALKIKDNIVDEYELECDYDRTIQVDKTIDGKKNIKEPVSPLEGGKFNIRTTENGQKVVTNSAGKDVTAEISIPGNNPSAVTLNLPSFAIPIGFSWVIENDNALNILKDMFAGIKLDTISAQVVFTSVFLSKSDETIAEFKLEIALTGKHQDSSDIIFAITILNHLNVDRNRIVRIFTDNTQSTNTTLRLRFENDGVTVDGIGSMQIDTQYSYSDQLLEVHKIVGKWNLMNRETSKINEAYSLEFCETGLLKYIHPHINGKDEIVDIGIWRIENGVLSTKIGRKRDIFSIKIEDQTLFLTRTIKTIESSNIFPWRVKQTDKYMKSVK